VTGQWFSPGTSVSSTNKTDRHDMAEILDQDGPAKKRQELQKPLNN
jgi:hypothetical protein